MDGSDLPGNTSGNQMPVGTSAADLLSATTYTDLTLELYFVEGFQPNQASLDYFEDFLKSRLNKPGQIAIRLNEIPSPGNSAYTIENLRNLEDAIRTAYNREQEIAVFGIFVDGAYAENTENSSVLGVAYRNTSFAIFEETLRNFTDAPLAPSRTTLETTVLTHEFGHLVGLVNAGSPLQSGHQDTAHGRHCTVEDCLMYWTAETGEGLINSLTGGTVPALDEQCIADLRANGGK